MCSFSIFPQFFHFSRPTSQNFISQFFVLQIFSSLNPFMLGETKGHTYYGYKQNLSEEKLNSQKLIWFYFLQKFFCLKSYVYLIWNF